MTTTVEAQGPVDVKVRALPCPFCGSGRIGCHAKRSGRKSGYQCRCLGCGVCQTGSFYDNPDVAKTVWNTRSNAGHEATPVRAVASMNQLDGN